MKKLLIVGSHPATRKSIPWDDDADIWTINEAGTVKDTWVKRQTAIFQLHPRAIWDSPLNTNDPHHGEWLKANKEVTVYMLENFPDVPMCKKYPLDEIQERFMSQLTVISPRGRNKIYTTTVAYMFALAAYLEYDLVEVWGVELSVESEYRYQRPGAMFWLGVLTQHAKVDFHGRMLDAPIYGFESDGDIDRAALAARLEQVRPIEAEAQKIAEEKNKLFSEAYNRFRETGVEQEAVTKTSQELTNALTAMANASGRRQELERLLNIIDTQIKIDNQFRLSHHHFERAETAILKEREKESQFHAHTAGMCDLLMGMAVKHRLMDSRRKEFLKELDPLLPQLYAMVQKTAIFTGAADENRLLASLVREQLIGAT